MLKIPQLDLQQKHQDHSGSGDQLVWEYVHDPVASAKDRKNFENRRYKFYKNIETTPKSSK
jgi:hypothetical protein